MPSQHSPFSGIIHPAKPSETDPELAILALGIRSPASVPR
jgi:hypothetical protein